VLSRPSDAVVRAVVIVVGVALVFGLVAAVITTALPRSFEASATLLIGRSTAVSDPAYQDLLASQLLAQTYAELATTRPILAAVAAQLRLSESTDSLASSITAQASGVNPIVRIRVRGAAPDLVARIANAVAQQLIAWKSTSGAPPVQAVPQLQASLATIDAQIARAQAEAAALQSPKASGGLAGPQLLQASLNRLASLLATRATLLQLLANTSTDTIQVVEPAEAPTDPARPGIVLNTAAAAILGALVAAGVLAATAQRRRLALES
jgi:capsular polysaccharide biosynthesis protein